MKRSIPVNPLTVITAILGAIGLGLRFWLNSCTDDRMLLPSWHISLVLLFILTALTLGMLLLSTAAMEKAKYRLRLKYGITRKIGAITGGLGLGAASVMALLESPTGLALIVALLGFLTAVAIFLFGFRPNSKLSFPLLCCVTVFFMLYAVSRAQYWGTLPQIQRYFFPLMALIFLVLTGYHRCELMVHAAYSRRFVFFNHAALFFCCVSLCEKDFLFYLGAACWLACDFTSVRLTKEEA